MTKTPKRFSVKGPLRVKQALTESNGNVEAPLVMQPKQGQESADRFGGQCIGHGDENSVASTLRLAVEESVSVSENLVTLQSAPQEWGQQNAANPVSIEKEAEKGREECCGPGSLRDSVALPPVEQPQPCPHPAKKKSRSGSSKHNARGDERGMNTSSYSRKQQNAAKWRWKSLASSILLARSSTNPVSVSEALIGSGSLSCENRLSLGQNLSNETEQIRSAESGQSHEIQPRKRKRTPVARKNHTKRKMQELHNMNVMESQNPSSDNPQSLGDNFANGSEQIRRAESGDSQATELQRKKGRKGSAASSKRNMQQIQKQQVRILSRMKTFLTEAHFLQTLHEDNDMMDKEAFIMTEDQRQAFAQAMVQSCQKNAKTRKVFLESVRKLTASGLMQAAAAKLLQKGSFEEAQHVMDAWGNFQQKDTMTLPMNLLNAVNQLHERGELAKEVSATEDFGIVAFHQMDDKAWRFSLPQLPAEEHK